MQLAKQRDSFQKLYEPFKIVNIVWTVNSILFQMKQIPCSSNKCFVSRRDILSFIACMMILSNTNISVLHKQQKPVSLPWRSQ